MTAFVESVVEEAALTWLEGLGYAPAGCYYSDESAPVEGIAEEIHA